MPSLRKINIDKVLTSLDVICSKCGKVITPALESIACHET
jgi:hypothetical protein